MKRDQVNYFVVGIFLLLLGGMFLFIVYKLTGAQGETDGYHVHYDNVAGLKYGTIITYKGYPVGQIESITPDSEGLRTRYRVEISVTKGWQIPSDSTASIVASGVLSGVNINIDEGKSSNALQPGSEIAGSDKANMFAALNDGAAALSSVAGDFRVLTTETLKPAIENFTGLMVSSKARMDDAEIFDELKSVIKRADDAAERLQRLLGEDNQQHVRNALRNAESVSANMDSLVKRIESTRQQMDHVMQELDKLVTGSAPGVSKTVGHASQSMADLQKSLQSVAENIDIILYNFEGTSRNINEFSRQIRENPGLLLNGSPQQDQAAAQEEKK